VDLDTTIVIAHSEKEQAAPTWKNTFGFRPMRAWADHGQDRNGEPLAIMLRAGNAGSNTAADHIGAARLAIAQLPRHMRRKVLIRADSGGGTHGFLEWLTARPRRLHYSVGMTITEDMREAIGKAPADAWTPGPYGPGRRHGRWRPGEESPVRSAAGTGLRLIADQAAIRAAANHPLCSISCGSADSARRSRAAHSSVRADSCGHARTR
jgi:hypothetical protein